MHRCESHPSSSDPPQRVRHRRALIVAPAVMLACVSACDRSAPTPAATPASSAPAAPAIATPASSSSASPAPAAAAAAAPASPESRPWRETWPSGKPKALCTLVRDPKSGKFVKHGLWQSWNEDGSLNKEGRYVYGEQDGEWKFYYPKVPRPIIEVYEMGKKVPQRR